jgi:hypothetical protein
MIGTPALCQSGKRAGDVLTVQKKLVFGALALSASRSLLQSRSHSSRDILTSNLGVWRAPHESAKHRMILQTQDSTQAGSAVTDAATVHAVRRRVFVQGNQVAFRCSTGIALLRSLTPTHAPHFSSSCSQICTAGRAC